MRNKRFIAEHRGGPLAKEQHRQLIKWACDCSEHVMYLLANVIDYRVASALIVAREWENENATTGAAMKAAVVAHAAAREFTNPVFAAVARSAGHAVATAHMADHSTGAADYALKAINFSGKSVEDERRWQDEQLPSEIRELVLSAREKRHLKI
jgi:hypothetical protein